MSEQGDDEVAKRARLVEAKLRDRQDRVAGRRQEMNDGPQRLIEAIGDLVSTMTGTSFAFRDTTISCFVGTEIQHIEQTLLQVEVANEDDELEDENWSLRFNIDYFAIIDDDGDFGAQSEYDLAFDDAVASGLEAVLDGMAVLLAQGNAIADANLILAPPTPPVQPFAPQPLPERDPDTRSRYGSAYLWLMTIGIALSLTFFVWLLGNSLR